MRIAYTKSSRIRLWALLVVAFAMLGLAGIASLVTVASSRADASAQRDLIRRSQLVAALLPQSESDGPRSQRLTAAVQDLPDAERAYVLIPAGRKLAISADSQGAKLPPNASSVALESSRAGVAGVDALPGDRLCAYIPLSAALPAKVLAVEFSGAAVHEPARQLRESGGIVAFLVVLLAAVIAQLLLPHLAPAEPATGSERVETDGIRTTGLEIVLGAVVFLVLLYGFTSFIAQKQAQKDLRTAIGKSMSIERLRGELVARLGHPVTLSSRAIHTLRELGIEWNASDGAGMLLDRLEATASREAESRQALALEAETHGESFSAVLIVAGLFAASALILMRAFSQQQVDLETAKGDSEKYLAAYRTMTENLPIGFFTYRDGDVQYWNEAWKRQKHLRPSETGREAFLRALHPDDRTDTIRRLDAACESTEPFEFSYRVQRSDGKIRHFEARGTPIRGADGQLEQLLGFAIDVTSRVEAQEILEEKNEEIETTNGRLEMALLDLEVNFGAVVDSLVRVVEAKDPYTAGHSNRVMGYSVRIGMRIGLDGDDLRTLQMGTLIHDIGKIGIPDAVLTKPGKLTPEEFRLIKEHPTIGARMVEDIPSLKKCIPIVLHHHERLDGMGYPAGLRAEDIPVLVRIAAVADCFDAMTSTRAYRSGRSVEAALEEMRKCATEGQLDLEIVEVLAEIVIREGLLWQPPLEQAA